ncbi:MAG: site-specific integrase, partial [Ferruginibacter sp.]
IILAVETAMRAGELVSLTTADIDPQARVARLADTKNGESRWVPLSPRALEALGVTEGRVVGLTASGLSHAFHELCLKEGIEGLRFHDLRREAVSRLFERGLNIAEVAAVSGHKTWAVLKRYTQLDARLLAKKLGTPPEVTL